MGQLINLSEIPRLILYRESPFSSIEYPDALSLWPEGARQLSSVDGGRDVLASGVIMAKHAMERSRPSEEVESLFRQLYHSNWYRAIWVASRRAFADVCEDTHGPHTAVRLKHARTQDLIRSIDLTRS
jgi:hypothetical protein